jgi:hypothetical protein
LVPSGRYFFRILAEIPARRLSESSASGIGVLQSSRLIRIGLPMPAENHVSR